MATREQVYRASILINSEQAENKIDTLKKQIAEVKARADKAFAEGKVDVWKAANKEAESLKKKLDKQERLAHGFSETMKNLSTAKSKELKGLIAQINKELDSPLIKKGSQQWNDYVAVLKDAKKELRELTEATAEHQSVGKSFFKFLNDSWGGLVIVFQTITGMSQTIRGAVQDYAAMEEEMADVRKYTGLTDEQVRELNEEFKKMDTRTSREQLNQLAGAAGRLGITSKEGIKDFVEAADMIGVALGDDLGDGAVDKIGKLAMAFGEDERKGLRGAMLATGSAINELAQNSSAQAGYLVEFTARVAGFGKQLGLTQAQIMGFGTVMDENLLKDEMAATAFGNMLTKMQTDTATFAKIAGQSVEEFAKLMREDANAAVLAVADSLKKQDPTTMMKMLDSMGLDGSRAVGVLSTLADKIDDVRRHQERATEAYGQATSVVNEFGTMNNTVQARLDKCKKAFKEMTVELGEKLLPVVKYTISGAGLLAKVLSTLMNFVTRNWRAVVTLTSGIVTYYTAVHIATVKEKLHAAAMVVSNAGHKAAIVLKKADAAATYLLMTSTDLLKGRITLAAAAQTVLNKVISSNPYVFVAGAVMTLAGAMTTFIGRSKDMTKAQQALKDVSEQAQSDIAGEVAELNSLVETARDKAATDDVRREAIKRLQEKYPDYLGNLSLEKIYTEDATTAIDNLTESLMAEAKARILVQRIKEAEDEKAKLDEEYFSGISGLWNSLTAQFSGMTNTIVDGSERILNALKGLSTGSLSGWEAPTWISENGYKTDPVQIQLERYAAAAKEAQDKIDALNKELKETVANQAKLSAKKPQQSGNESEDGAVIPASPYRSEADIKKEQAEQRKRLAAIRKEESETAKLLREQAEESKAVYQSQIASEMMSYRQGEINYTQYMENRHQRTQEYYDELKKIYGEDSTEYRKMLDNREREEMQYYQWKAKLDEQQLTMDKIQREQSIRRQYMQQQVVDTEAMNEALFQSDMTYMKQKQNLYKKGSKEWLDLQMQMDSQQKQHQFRTEQQWLEKLNQYREQTGHVNYDKMMELEIKGAETFYTTLLDMGKMTQEEYDAIFEHIRRNYAELKVQQKANNDVQVKAGKSLDMAKKNAEAKDVNSGSDAATGIFSITHAISQQKAINEQLKQLYGEDYENNREYQEAKRQLDAETMDKVVAGAQAAYSTISTLISAASSYAQACSDVEVARITANYDKQIEAAGNNNKKREKLEKEKDKAIAKAKTQANKKAMAMEYAQAVASTALAAINAYASAAKLPPPAGQTLPPIMAGIALAAGAIQIATINKQHEAEAAGYYEGGFTGGKRYRKEAGVVHEGEFVANHQAVENRQLMPVLSLIDQAQRNNRVASLRAEDVTNVMGGPAAAAVITPIVNVQTDNEELREAVAAHREATEQLLARLEEPIDARVVLTGPDGLNEQQKRLNRMMKNK